MADEIRTQNPGRFDAYKINSHGEWISITKGQRHVAQSSTPPPIPNRANVLPNPVGAIPSSQSVSNVPKPNGRSWRQLRRRLVVAAFLVWSLGMICTGARLRGKFEQPGGILRNDLKFATKNLGIRQMTKAEFREKFREIKKASTYTKVSVLYDTFGKPSRTQLVGEYGYWYWSCSDGEMQMVLPKTSQFSVEEGRGENKIVMAESLNDY
jgi:hypothetical protein